ncbi:MAG: Cache 3/Cache 2 fusion domain-containing protein, partial [Patescibacteria group bacterium]|nr:Cache 3/Cache 2 fusion domain-containing protein [Patescibacteria group bacterium]
MEPSPNNARRVGRFTVRTQIILLALVGPLAIAAGVCAFVPFIESAMCGYLERTMHDDMKTNLGLINQGVYNMVATQDQLLRTKLSDDLAVARDVLRRAGEPTLGKETVSWDAVNQFTGSRTTVALPRMLAGGTWLGKNDATDTPSPIVDEVRDLVGGTCTVFQRMNAAGDMLRVSTNVTTQDGMRAIGTYIPVTNPDGKPNPVIATVLGGSTYVGRAYVVNAWYLAAYEPIRNTSGEVIGMLYAGILQESVADLRKAIMDIKVGETGYVFVLGGEGTERGKYLLSHQGKRDGEMIWEAKDAGGRPFIQEIVAAATKTQRGESDFVSYPWKNEGDAAARMKTSAVTYYEPWDWVIGAGTYEDEFQAAVGNVSQMLRQNLVWGLGAGAIVLLLVGVSGVTVGSRISRMLGRLIAETKRLGDAAVAGKLEVRGNPELVTAEFQPIIRGINATLDAVIGPLNVAAEYVERISKGDIPDRITDEYRGDFNEIKNNLNQCVVAVNLMADDARMLAENAVQGKLATRADASRHQGDFRRIIEGVNKTLDAVIGPLNVAAEYVDRLSKGDVPAPITDEYRGDFNELKVNLNQCIASINALLETGDAVKQVAQGNLDARGDESKVRGRYREMVAAVNSAMEAFLIPASDIGEILKIMANKDFSKEVEKEYPGIFGELRANVNMVVHNIRDAMALITESAAQAAEGSQVIANSAQNLAAGAEEQSATVEQITAAVEELSRSVESVQGNAQEADKVSRETSHLAEQGGTAVRKSAEAMEMIRTSSEQIAEIIQVISEIASQTNLLALNAAIEAARAGEHG